MSKHSIETRPLKTTRVQSMLRWLVASVNSWIHFLPLFIITPFSRRMGEALYQSWARKQLRIYGISVSLHDENLERRVDEPILCVWLNQSNLVEGAVIGFLLSPGFVVINLEFALMPLTGMARALLGDVVIIRQWKKQAKRGIERAAKRLASGDSGLISIEGARSADGTLLPYKKGPAVLAINTQATIIPLAMFGGRELQPSGSWRIEPGNVRLHCLKAIPTRGLTYDDRDAVVEQLRAIAEETLG